MLSLTHPDTALIFEGGGMRGSFSAGVASVLIAENLHLGWVGGISAGSSCLVNYISRDPRRAERSFVDIAAEPEFGSWSTWIRGKGVFNSEWIYENTSLPHQALPLDTETFFTSPTQLRIGGFRCHDGEMIYWGRGQVPDLPSLVQRVRASSTMPLLMPLTAIDGEEYCDGALGPTGGIALDAAINDGYERFLIVLTRERGYQKPAVRFSHGFRLLFKRYPAVAQGLLDRPANYNRTLEQLLELERQGRAYLVFPDAMPISSQERNVEVLRSIFRSGAAQARRELPAIKEFLAP